jgi:hypothetical protein
MAQVRIAQAVATRSKKNFPIAGIHALIADLCDRDHNAAINIKYRAVGHPVLKAQEMSDAIAGVTEKPALYASA